MEHKTLELLDTLNALIKASGSTLVYYLEECFSKEKGGGYRIVSNIDREIYNEKEIQYNLESMIKKTEQIIKEQKVVS